jgi:hypothetical protein
VPLKSLNRVSQPPKQVEVSEPLMRAPRQSGANIDTYTRDLNVRSSWQDSNADASSARLDNVDAVESPVRLVEAGKVLLVVGQVDGNADDCLSRKGKSNELVRPTAPWLPRQRAVGFLKGGKNSRSSRPSPRRLKRSLTRAKTALVRSCTVPSTQFPASSTTTAPAMKTREPDTITEDPMAVMGALEGCSMTCRLVDIFHSRSGRR